MLYNKTFFHVIRRTAFLLDRLRANVANDFGTLDKRQVGTKVTLNFGVTHVPEGGGTHIDICYKPL